MMTAALPGLFFFPAVDAGFEPFEAFDESVSPPSALASSCASLTANLVCQL
jgi:hypothetical protein